MGVGKVQGKWLGGADGSYGARHKYKSRAVRGFRNGGPTSTQIVYITFKKSGLTNVASPFRSLPSLQGYSGVDLASISTIQVDVTQTHPFALQVAEPQQ